MSSWRAQAARDCKRSEGEKPVPTDVPARHRPRVTSEVELVAAFSLLPWFACLLLAHAYPAVAHAYVLLGQLG